MKKLMTTKIYSYYLFDFLSFISLPYRVSLLQPTSPKFKDFADQVRDRATKDYNYTFSENEEVQI